MFMRDTYQMPLPTPVVIKQYKPQTRLYMHKLTAVLVKIYTLTVIVILVALCENKIFTLACAVVRLKAINPCYKV